MIFYFYYSPVIFTESPKTINTTNQEITTPVTETTVVSPSDIVTVGTVLSKTNANQSTCPTPSTLNQSTESLRERFVH